MGGICSNLDVNVQGLWDKWNNSLLNQNIYTFNSLIIWRNIKIPKIFIICKRFHIRQYHLNITFYLYENISSFFSLFLFCINTMLSNTNFITFSVFAFHLVLMWYVPIPLSLFVWLYALSTDPWMGLIHVTHMGRTQPNEWMTCINVM